MQPIDDLFNRLARSPFRARFRLSSQDHTYIATKSMDVVLDHGRAFVAGRLAAALPKNDGKQTPMRGHPVFVAQHATATCCRGCLRKWHGIAEGRTLSQQEQDYVLSVIARWLNRETADATARQDLFFP